MPTYTYSCAHCGKFDVVHAMGDQIMYCEMCGLPDIKKVFGNVGISFKGSGFYSTDSKRGSK